MVMPLIEHPVVKTAGPKPVPFFGPTPAFGDERECGLWLFSAAPLPDGRWECQWAWTGALQTPRKMSAVLSALKAAGHELGPGV